MLMEAGQTGLPLMLRVQASLGCRGSRWSGVEAVCVVGVAVAGSEVADAVFHVVEAGNAG